MEAKCVLERIPVHLVDDDASVRDALRYLLEGYGFIVEDYADGNSFLERVDPAEPGCLVLDSRMPGLSGQQVQQQLNSVDSCLEVMFLTSHGDLPMAVKAFRDGACDFHRKPVNSKDLIGSIERAQQISLLRYQKLRYRRLFDTLTERERQLFDLVVQGLINKQIADQLCISVRTVEVHRAKMMERLGAFSIAELGMIAAAVRS